MDTELKHKIAEKVIEINDDDLLDEIKALVGLSERDFWNDIPLAVRHAINKAKDQLDNGEGVPHADVMADVKARFLPK